MNVFQKQKALSFNRAFEKVGDGLAWASENVISPLIEWAGNDLLPKAFDTVAGSVELLAEAFEFIKEPAKRAWEVLQPYASGTLDVIAGTFDLVSKAVGGLASEFEGVDWSGYWDDINNGEFFANWKSGWEDISDWFSEHDKDIEDFFDVSDVGTAWREFWEGVGGDVADAQERWTYAFEILSVTITKAKDAFNDFVETWQLGWKTLTGLGEKTHDITKNSLGGIVLDKIIEKIPAFAGGGVVTQPTLAIVGEREPEYIIPESKMDKVYSHNGGNVYVEKVELIMNGSIDLGSAEDRRRLIEEMSSELRMLNIAEERAMGGAAWS